MCRTVATRQSPVFVALSIPFFATAVARECECSPVTDGRSHVFSRIDRRIPHLQARQCARSVPLPTIAEFSRQLP